MLTIVTTEVAPNRVLGQGGGARGPCRALDGYGRMSRPNSLDSGLFGDVAQLGERLVRNEEVGGSIPLISTSMVAQRRV